MPPSSAKRSPRPSASPSRRSSRAVGTPQRLVNDDDWGMAAASSYKGAGLTATPSGKKTNGAAMFAKGGSTIVGVTDLVAIVAAAYYWFGALKISSFARITASVTDALTSSPTETWALVGFIAVAQAGLYSYVWYKPSAFKKMCKALPLKLLGKSAIDVFSILVALSKSAQQLAVLNWAGKLDVDSIVSLLTEAPSNTAALVLLVVGSALNFAVYRAIGKAGVYYGFKLGAKVPWATGFPFNVGFRHPQYVGSFISQLGVLLLLATPATLESGLLLVALSWFAMYATSAAIEAAGDNKK